MMSRDGVFNHRERDDYLLAVKQIEDIFSLFNEELAGVRHLAEKVKKGLERISPFIQEHTEKVCPRCIRVCCINAHGYYGFEDLIYIRALGLKLPDYYSCSADSAPCRFLSDKGCRLERTIRPSGCNWYFCDALFDQMEPVKGYAEFDTCLGEVAELWMNMMMGFNDLSKKNPAATYFPMASRL